MIYHHFYVCRNLIQRMERSKGLRVKKVIIICYCSRLKISKKTLSTENRNGISRFTVVVDIPEKTFSKKIKKMTQTYFKFLTDDCDKNACIICELISIEYCYPC